MAKLNKLIGDPEKLEKLVDRYTRATEENKAALDELMIASDFTESVLEWESKLKSAKDEFNKIKADCELAESQVSVMVSEVNANIEILDQREKDFDVKCADLDHNRFVFENMKKDLYKKMAEVEDRGVKYAEKLKLINDKLSIINAAASELPKS